MSKYDFALDMKTDNSVSQILRYIRPDSDVLEIACAHGRMTKYLRETLRCRVSIVEKDGEAAQAAAPFASDATLVGRELGDLEKDGWHNYLRKNRHSFDYIIFADMQGKHDFPAPSFHPADAQTAFFCISQIG